VLTEEQVRRISGGDCTIADIQSALDQLQQSYDTLVDFTSYVIEGVVRTVASTGPPPAARASERGRHESRTANGPAGRLPDVRGDAAGGPALDRFIVQFGALTALGSTIVEKGMHFALACLVIAAFPQLRRFSRQALSAHRATGAPESRWWRLPPLLIAFATAAPGRVVLVDLKVRSASSE
jgi:hypothetical protein